MKKLVYYFFLFVYLLSTSCSSDSENDLVDPNDLPETITYSNTIKAIISNNCIRCHSDPTENGAPFPLTNYNQVLTRAESGILLTAISRQTGESRAMPTSGRMPQSTIDLVEQWINNGFIEE